jgi:V-type H+-transporting ATPase subunit a
MSFAICLNVFNHIHYKTKAFVWLEFLPQILFMESIFGYLIFCIMYKWSIHWWALDDQGHHIYNAPPNLLNMLIYMFLTPGKVNPQDQLYPGQGKVQLVLIIVAVICVPWMWFAKPYYLKMQHEKQGTIRLLDDEEEVMEAPTAAVASTEAATRAVAVTNRTEAAFHQEEDEEDLEEEASRHKFMYLGVPFTNINS